MTEVDVIMDMKCCVKNDCENCSMDGTHDCATTLYRNAIALLQMQYETLATKSRINTELEKERDSLKEKKELEMTKDNIVNGVNHIIHESFKHGATDEDDEDWTPLILTLQTFLRETNLCRYFHIVIDAKDPYPRIERKNTCACQ
jgi:hypothetical protein